MIALKIIFIVQLVKFNLPCFMINIPELFFYDKKVPMIVVADEKLKKTDKKR